MYRKAEDTIQRAPHSSLQNRVQEYFYFLVPTVYDIHTYKTISSSTARYWNTISFIWHRNSKTRASWWYIIERWNMTSLKISWHWLQCIILELIIKRLLIFIRIYSKRTENIWHWMSTLHCVIINLIIMMYQVMIFEIILELKSIFRGSFIFVLATISRQSSSTQSSCM